MKRKIVIMMSLVLVVIASEAWAIAFYEDGTIENGEEYVSVGVHNNAILDMTGGIVTFQLTTYDFSTANIFGGTLETLLSTDDSTISLFNSAEVGGMSVNSLSRANMYGGSVNT